MLTHSRAHIRKRAVLALFKVLTQYPDLTASAMTRLRERLDDPDPGESSPRAWVLPILTPLVKVSSLPLSMSYANYHGVALKTICH